MSDEFETLLQRLQITCLDGYVFAGLLGQGGQGHVARYRASDGKEVAVKFLIAPTSKDAISRFYSEAEALRAIALLDEEQTIVRAHGPAKQVSGVPVHYFFMDLARGESLEARIARIPAPWPWRDCLATILRIAGALAPAHMRGLIHRDLHPGNIILDDLKFRPPNPPLDDVPGAVILDFGVHRSMWAQYEELEIATHGTFRPVGSVKYASPEALRDPTAVTPRSDSWALGTILYRLITGEMPFHATTLAALADQKAHGKMAERAPARDANREEDEMIGQLLDRLLAPDPNARWWIMEAAAMCHDALVYPLARLLAEDTHFRQLYFRARAKLDFCLQCQSLSVFNGSRCTNCGRPSEDYTHWSMFYKLGFGKF